MNEYFVSFELAKMLKEKGFREKCLAYYDAEDNVGLLYNTQYSNELLPCQYTDLLASYNSGDIAANLDTSDNCIDAPTFSQVLKWLRKEKKIYICVDVCEIGWFFCINKSIDTDYSYDVEPSEIEYYDCYDAAVLMGIEYVLDSLICSSSLGSKIKRD